MLGAQVLAWLLGALGVPAATADSPLPGCAWFGGERWSPLRSGQGADGEDVDAAESLEQDTDKLGRVAWTTERRLRLLDLSKHWDIPKKRLVALNPEIDRRTPLAIGTSVWVYRADVGAPDRSIGFPNKGRLVAAVTMPEGPYWRMRRGRQRAYGTRETIGSLVTVLTAYGETFPDAPLVQLGDISARRGGVIEPHRSHKTGRDVDLRLVRMTRTFASGRERRVIDLDKTWFIVRQLVGTGRVQSIYLSTEVQKRLWPTAEADIGADEAERVFETLQHANGHRRHMHIRFRCPEEHRRCIADSRRDSSG